ncbi:MAG: hypothetical protein IK132_06160 [Clostridia bacterium]|nr:hypothetical protein [Clostridia bacterium]
MNDYEKAPQIEMPSLDFPQGVGFEPTRAFAQTVFKIVSGIGKCRILADDDGSYRKIEEAEK